MDKTFDPSAVEARWRDSWETSGAFKPRARADGSSEPYCIVIPPPNVTGTLHMGHAFQHTVMDTLTRYHRMRGFETLWQPGTDHAGIATQMVVERNLKLEGVSRLDLGRDKFVEKVWEWKAYSGGTIERLIRRMGSSVDWSRNAFTMNPDYSTAVIEHFVKLHEAGLVYRGKRLVNWDPVLQTAISDLEVVSEEENGKLWHIRYPLAAGLTYTTAEGETRNYIVVATTRPETMLGDTAVAVHPEDERYKHLIGKTVMLPLCNREIPIIGDDYVDREFGTGCVKITPAHDFNDYAVGQRHNLSLINIFTPTAVINEAAPTAYRGLDRFEARKRVVADLEAAGLLEKIDDHKLKVPRGDRTGVVVEPYLTNQWFVDLTRKTLDDGRPGGWSAITEPAIKAVEEGRIKFVPENWSSTYFHWLRNIQDWCISRQLWWGHRIPAWYDANGNVYVARTETEVRSKYKLAADLPLTQDNDVFDTWFSSDIWPIATLGWPQQTPELNKFYPTSVLVTGFDIIFFWVARMVMMGQYFIKDEKGSGAPPFREVYVHGLIRDGEGQKMSKSKGNVLDPLDLVDGIALEDLVKKRTTGLMKPETAPKIEKATRKEYPKGIAPVGVDALRFTFSALASPGRDIRFDAGRAEGYRNFCNKIWNAARFVLMNCEDKDVGLDASLPVTLGEADRWIVSRLQKLEAEVAEHVRQYRFDLLAQALYQFIWNEYCDWYLELTKPALQAGDEAAQRGTRRTLVRVLETWLRLLHPLMPFITEEIWQRIAPLADKHGDTIMLQAYPQSQPEKIDEAAEADVEWLKNFILAVRQIRGEMNISPAKAVPVLVQNAASADIERIERLRGSACFLAKIETLRVLATGEAAPYSAVAALGSTKILIPMAGLIDKDAELARLGKEITKRDNELVRLDGRLADDKFVNGAPPAVIEKERARLAQLKQELDTLREQENRIREL
jgi:valyl-tRNA synthetase